MANIIRSDYYDPERTTMALILKWVESDLSWYDQTIADEEELAERARLRAESMGLPTSVSTQGNAESDITIIELHTCPPKPVSPPRRPPVKRSVGYDYGSRKAETREYEAREYEAQTPSSSRKQLNYERPQSTVPRLTYASIASRDRPHTHLDWYKKYVSPDYISPFDSVRRVDSQPVSDHKQLETTELPPDDYMRDNKLKQGEESKDQVNLDVPSPQIPDAHTISSEEKTVAVKPIESTTAYLTPEVSLDVSSPQITEAHTTSSKKKKRRHHHRRSRQDLIQESNELINLEASIPTQEFSPSLSVTIEPIESTAEYLTTEVKLEDQVSLDVSTPQITKTHATSSEKKKRRHHHRRPKQSLIPESSELINLEASIPTQEFSPSSPVAIEAIESTAEYLTTEVKLEDQVSLDVSTPQITETPAASSEKKKRRHHHRKSRQNLIPESSELTNLPVSIPIQEFSSSPPVAIEPIESTAEYLTTEVKLEDQISLDVTSPQITEADTTSSKKKKRRHHHRRSKQYLIPESSELINPATSIPTQEFSSSSPVAIQPIESTAEYLTPEVKLADQVSLDDSSSQIPESHTTPREEKIHQHHHRKSKQNLIFESNETVTPAASVCTQDVFSSSPVAIEQIESTAEYHTPEVKLEDQVSLDVSSTEIPESHRKPREGKIHQHHHRKSKQNLISQSNETFTLAAPIPTQNVSSSSAVAIEPIESATKYLTSEIELEDQISLDVTSAQITEAQTTSSEKKKRQHHHRKSKQNLIFESNEAVTPAASIRTQDFSLSSPVAIEPIESTAEYLTPEVKLEDQVSLDVCSTEIPESHTTPREEKIHQHHHRKSKQNLIFKSNETFTPAAPIPTQDVSSSSPVAIEPIESATKYLTPEIELEDQISLDVTSPQITEAQMTSSKKKKRQHHHRKSKQNLIFESNETVTPAASICTQDVFSSSPVAIEPIESTAEYHTPEVKLENQVSLDVSSTAIPESHTTPREGKIHQHHHRKSKQNLISESNETFTLAAPIPTQDVSSSSPVVIEPIKSTTEYHTPEVKLEDQVSLDVSSTEIPESHTTPREEKIHQHHHRKSKQNLIFESNETFTPAAPIPTQDVSSSLPVVIEPIKSTAEYLTPEIKLEDQIPESHMTSSGEKIHQHHHRKSKQNKSFKSNETFTPAAAIPTQELSSSSPVAIEPVELKAKHLTTEIELEDQVSLDVSSHQIPEAQTTSSKKKIHRHHHRRSTLISESGKIITPATAIPTEELFSSLSVGLKSIELKVDSFTSKKRSKDVASLDDSSSQISEAQTTSCEKKIHRHHHRSSKHILSSKSADIISPAATTHAQEFYSSSRVAAKPIESTTDYITPEKQSKDEGSLDISIPKIPETHTTTSREQKIHRHHHRRSKHILGSESADSPAATTLTQEFSSSSQVAVKPIGSITDYITPEKQSKDKSSLDISTPKTPEPHTTTSSERKIHRHHHRRSKHILSSESADILTSAATTMAQEFSSLSQVVVKPIESTSDYFTPDKQSKVEGRLDIATPKIPETHTTTSREKKIHRHHHRSSKHILSSVSAEINVSPATILPQEFSSSSPVTVKPIELTTDYIRPEKQSKDEGRLDVAAPQIPEAETKATEKKIHRHHHRKHTLISESANIITPAVTISTQELFSSSSIVKREEQSEHDINLNVSSPQIPEAQTISSKKRVHRHHHRRSTLISESREMITPATSIPTEKLISSLPVALKSIDSLTSEKPSKDVTSLEKKIHQHHHRRSKNILISESAEIITPPVTTLAQEISSTSPVTVKPIESTTDYITSGKQSKDEGSLDVSTPKILETHTTTSSEKKIHRHHHRRSKHILSSESTKTITLPETTLTQEFLSSSPVAVKPTESTTEYFTPDKQSKEEGSLDAFTPQIPEVQTISRKKEIRRHHHSRSKHTLIPESDKIISPTTTVTPAQDLSLSLSIAVDPDEVTDTPITEEQSKGQSGRHTPHEVKKFRHHLRRMRRTMRPESDAPITFKQEKSVEPVTVYPLPVKQLKQQDSLDVSVSIVPVVIETIESAVELKHEEPLSNVPELKIPKIQTSQKKEYPLTSICKLVENVDLEFHSTSEESKKKSIVEDSEAQEKECIQASISETGKRIDTQIHSNKDEVALLPVTEIAGDDQCSLDASVPAISDAKIPEKKKKKRYSRKSKPAVQSMSEESVTDGGVIQEPSVSPNKTPKSKISTEESKTTDISLDKAEVRHELPAKEEESNVQPAKRRTRKSKKQQSAIRVLEEHETLKLEEEKQSLKDPLKETAKPHEPAESSLQKVSDIESDAKTNSIVRRMGKITGLISKTHEKINAMLKDPNTKFKMNSIKRLTDLENQIECYKLEIQELRRQLTTCKPAVSLESGSSTETPEITTQSSVPETVQTDIAQVDALNSFKLPMKLPVKPTSCVLDTRRNLLSHLDESFKPIGDGDITSDFLKSWIFLKKSAYKHISLFDVKTAQKLVAQHRLDKKSLPAVIVNPPYSILSKPEYPLILKLVVPYGSTHMDIVVERNRKEYLIHFHSINYSVFYEFAPQTIHKFLVDPTVATVNKLPGNYVYRFIILNRVTQYMYLVATKGPQVILLKLFYSASFAVDEQFSSSQSPDYMQYWYNRVIEDARESAN